MDQNERKKNELYSVQKRLVKEGLLRSLLAGLAVGFGANFVAALICWLCGYGSIWLSIGVGVLCAVIGGAVFYFARFKPNITDAARRVDALGLEERTITMIGLGAETSFMAEKQKRDAESKLSQVKAANIGIYVSRALVISVLVCALFGIGMTTVSGLAIAGILPGGETILPGFGDQFLEVSYLVEEGGEIQGDPEQLLLPGENASPVMAVADEGWSFMGWDDGITTPYREDKEIEQGFVATALFEQLGEDDEDPDAPTGGEGDDEEAPDSPGDGSGDGSGESESGSGEGNSGEGSGSGENGDVGEGDGKGQGNGAGGRFEESNKVIDGETYYKDELEEYYQHILDLLESGEELSEEEREFLEKYFGSL